jgi:hypothetical protein
MTTENKMKYHMYTFIFLGLAVGSYAIGTFVGLALFIALGVVSESIFWVRLLRGAPGVKKSS